MASSPQPPAMDLIALPHQVELLSDRWFDEAAKFFAEALPPRRPSLGGQAFSLSARVTDAPPHLKFANDSAAVTVRFDGQDVTIDRAFASTADVTLECDYQAALSLAQFVGVLVPGAAEAMWREARQIFGADAFRL